jgi:hypothetical protein
VRISCSDYLNSTGAVHFNFHGPDGGIPSQGGKACEILRDLMAQYPDETTGIVPLYTQSNQFLVHAPALADVVEALTDAGFEIDPEQIRVSALLSNTEEYQRYRLWRLSGRLPSYGGGILFPLIEGWLDGEHPGPLLDYLIDNPPLPRSIR